MQTVQEWLARPDVRQAREASLPELVSEKFFRDPMRPLRYDPYTFYSPADGFVLYSLTVGPSERIVAVKGRNLTTRELLQDPEYFVRSLVVGVFLTFYDVHVNRMPTDGYVHFRRPPALGDESMIPVEASILGHGNLNPNDLAYAFTNERVVTRVYSPRIQQSYYLVQIADREVDTISLFVQDGECVKQGQRFGAIRFGSQVDLIVPLRNTRFKFTNLVEGRTLYHVEAGMDLLVKAEPNDANP
jgi:phosphatidylserine decarboxylase